MKRPSLFAILFFLPLLLSAKVSLTAITVEGRHGCPEGLDEAQPRFGWVIESDENDVVQTGYRILVASSERNLKTGDVWDSGIVRSGQSQWVEYGGKPLLPDHTYYVKVMVTTNKGKASCATHWSTGLLGEANWAGASWIGTDSLQPGDTVQRHSRAAVRYFRKEFVTHEAEHGKVVRAMAHVSGLGYFTLYVNGQRVGRDVMAPPQTDFTKTVAYCSYDVTRLLDASVENKEERIKNKLGDRRQETGDGQMSVLFGDRRQETGDGQMSAQSNVSLQSPVSSLQESVSSLQEGNNAIGVAVAPGYFFAPTQKYQTNVRVSYGLPRLRLLLSIEYEDGKREVVVTDKTWRMTADGPIRYSNIYDGELYDANKGLGDWTKTGYDDAAWLTPDIVKAPGGKMRGNITPPMRVYKVDRPVSVLVGDRRQETGDSQMSAQSNVSLQSPVSSLHVIDFGSNGAGVTEFLVEAEKGDTVRIRHAELLQSGDSSQLYTDNLRHAQCTDYYVSDGTPTVWHPEFTWHGYRYVEISGVRSLDTARVRRLLIADDMETEGDSICIYFADAHLQWPALCRPVDRTLQKVIANAYRGIRSNYKSFPIDCPNRDERMPWTGDRTTGCLGESYLMDNHALYAKWVADFRDSQRKDGALSDVTPAYWRLYNGNVTWPAALPFACDMLYRQYGDIRPLRDSWQTITRWLDYVKAKSYKDGLVTYDRYGDWCVPPESPKVVVSKDPARNTDGTLISSTYYYYLCKMLARYARPTGNAADSVKYEQEAETTKAAINKAFLHETGYANNTVTANLLPLAMGIVPEEKVPAVKDRLISTIHANGDHISCGVIGIQWLLRYLSNNGYGWLAYKIATQETYPGWGYMAKNGATTIWELWNGNTANPSMNSGNHVMLLGDLLPWAFEYLGGIRPTPALPYREGESGFKHIVMKPDFSIDIPYGVSVSHRSPYGNISSQWKRKDGKITWEVRIPANCTAELHLPDTVLTVGSGHRTVVYDAAMQRRTQQCAAPTMGWSSWNTYRVNINDSLIMRQADAMVATGLSKLGYKYINIDDGYFGGRDSTTGQLLVHPTRFPNGLKPVVDHIHGLGLKAGIYSDGGNNTCGSYYDNDSIGVGVGLYGHDHQDCDFFFRKMGFDFIKVDFCGGVGKKGSQVLDERERYTAIANAIKTATSPTPDPSPTQGRGENGSRDGSYRLAAIPSPPLGGGGARGGASVRLNVCRWDYPGTWVHDVAFSWRTTSDISPRWSKVRDIIAQNLYLSAYAYGGRYNDMDMLEVGRGMTGDEDRTHFGLWCFMNSPLLIGCDLTKIRPATLDLLKNERLIALNQDPLHDQPSVVEKQNGCFILVRDIKEAHGNDRAFAIYNPTDETREVTVDFKKLSLGGKVTLEDCFGQPIDIPTPPLGGGGGWSGALPPHATAIYTAHCTKRLPQTRYEAEAAYISDYQELKNNQAVGTGIYEYDDSCSGGLKATWLGGRPDNDLVFRDVYVDKAGEYTLDIATVGSGLAKPEVEVNGVKAGGKKIRLNKGFNRIRLFNGSQRMADIDYIEITKQ